MAESDEHKYLTTSVLSAMESLSSLKLYAYREAARRKYDFGCELQRDWTQAVSGQILWKHVEGVDKDIRTLLINEDAEVLVYVARDDTKARNIFYEAMADYRRSRFSDRLHRLKVFWIPRDFDAQQEDHQALIDQMLLDRVAEDLLLNVVFGNLNRDSITHFLRGSGQIGLDFAILDSIARQGFFNFVALARCLGVAPGTVRPRADRLVGCGFLDQPSLRGGDLSLSRRGAVFLELSGLVLAQISELSPELLQMLYLLGLDPRSAEDPIVEGDEAFRHPLSSLTRRARAAQAEWGVSFQATWLAAC